MGNVSSTLTMRLIDGVTGNAARVSKSLRGVDKNARQVEKRSRASAAAMLASGARFGLAAGGGYMAARGLKRTVAGHAELERRVTRIALTADATRKAGKAAIPVIRAIADEAGLLDDQVTDGLDTLVAQGRSLEEAMAFLPSVARTAQASGAAVSDIANSAEAVSNAFDISADQMQHAFDVLVAGGKAGKFELRDMAQYLPSLAPAAAAIGLKGEEGLRKLVAMLQVVRAQTGSAGEAATATANIFQKMETEETAKKFAKMGVDLRKEMALARREGRELVDVFLDLSETALQGDLSKLPQLFTDAEFARGMRALLNQRDAVNELEAALSAVNGVTMGDLGEVLKDNQTKIDRLSNSTSRLGDALGGLAVSSGLAAAMDSIAAAANSASGVFDKMSKGDFFGSGGALSDLREGLRQDDESDAYLEEYKGLTGEDGDQRKAMKQVSLNPFMSDPDQARDAARVDAYSRLAADDRAVWATPFKKNDIAALAAPAVRKVQTERERQVLPDVFTVGAALPPLKTDGFQRIRPGRLNAQKAFIKDLNERGREFPVSAGGASADNPAPTMGRLDKSLLAPESEAARSAALETMNGFSQGLSEGGRRAVEEAEAISRRIEATFSRLNNITIRPRVEAPSLSSARGRLSEELNGGYYDRDYN